MSFLRFKIFCKKCKKMTYVNEMFALTDNFICLNLSCKHTSIIKNIKIESLD